MCSNLVRAVRCKKLKQKNTLFLESILLFVIKSGMLSKRIRENIMDESLQKKKDNKVLNNLKASIVY